MQLLYQPIRKIFICVVELPDKNFDYTTPIYNGTAFNWLIKLSETPVLEYIPILKLIYLMEECVRTATEVQIPSTL
jgi:hypothetical protein